MFQHLHAILLATATLVMLGAAHRPSPAAAEPAAQPSPFQSPVRHLETARVSSLVGASVRSISVGF